MTDLNPTDTDATLKTLIQTVGLLKVAIDTNTATILKLIEAAQDDEGPNAIAEALATLKTSVDAVAETVTTGVIAQASTIANKAATLALIGAEC